MSLWCARVLEHSNRRLLQIDISNSGMVKNGWLRPPKVRAGRRKKKRGRAEEEEEEEEEEEPRAKKIKAKK